MPVQSVEQEKSGWVPEIPVYEPEVSFYESMGGIVRSMWQEKYRYLEGVIQQSSKVMFTDIGGGVSTEEVIWSADGAKGIKQHGDGLRIPPFVPLEKKFGFVPRALFLVASTRTPDEMLGLCSVAEEYRRQGVDYIFPVFTAFPHERQDHHFIDKQGEPIYQAETLQTMIRMIARSGLIDGGLVLQPHSMQVTRIGFTEGLTLLPIDASNYLLEMSGVRSVQNPFVIGPDKGRRNIAKWLATKLNCPYGVCKKSRARTTDCLPEVEIPKEVLQYIQEHDCSPVVFDDEIREAGTAQALRRALAGWAKRFYMYAVKGFFADMNGTNMTAAQALALPLEYQGEPFRYDKEFIMVTDAVAPIKPVNEIADKLRVMQIRGDIENLTQYLQNNFVPNGNENWLRDENEMRTLLRLDLMVERYL